MRALKVQAPDVIVVGGEECELEVDEPIRPVYVVAVPATQIALAVMCGVIMASVVIAFVGFLLAGLLSTGS